VTEEELKTESPAPIAVTVSTDDVRALFACETTPYQYMQLILAKLKDAGAPVEGMLELRLAHGKVAKLKDSALEPQTEFTYVWLPELYVHAIAGTA
jgi:hypothetical protein